MTLHEIFYSIQGEGAKVGNAAVFIRFAGCNLDCPWCDTNHSEVSSLTATEIIKKVDQYPSNFIILTGGEPMLQPREELLHLIDCLVFRNKFIALETNGVIYDEMVSKEIDWITVSPKLGSSINVPYNEICELKYIMVPALTLKDIPTKKQYKRFIYLQPLSQNEESTLRCIDWVQKFPDRFSLSVQLHKYLNLR